VEILTQCAAVAGVLTLLALVLSWLRRRGWAGWRLPVAKARRLRAVERVALGPHHSLHLVELDGSALLVACSPRGCHLVGGAGRGAGPEGSA
jgi:flagellar biogenesis protein FliO